MSGSEQFLGQQLSKQAAALGELVVKMQLMIEAQEQSIDKFSIISEEVKRDVVYGVGVAGLALNSSDPLTIITYLNGKIKIRMRVHAIPSATLDPQVRIYINGVLQKTEVVVKGTTVDVEFELAILENDIITIYSPNANYIYMESYKILYSLIPKPQII